MPHYRLAPLITVILAASVAMNAKAADVPQPPVADASQYSYAVTYRLIQQLQDSGVPLDEQAMLRAFVDATQGRQAELNGAHYTQALTHFQQLHRQVQARQLEQQAVVNLQAGEQFLSENAKRDGVTLLPSGLQYRVLQTGGGGRRAQARDAVDVHYEGRLLQGRVFDSSYKRGGPATFQVSEVIPGWQEALQLMPVNAKWELYVPAALAYGDNGMGGGMVPPNEVLVFTVELLDIHSD